MGIWSWLGAVTGKRIDRKGAPPVASFTFDDAPVSAFLAGGEILESHGYRGTYYVSAGMAGKTAAVGEIADVRMVRDAHRRGHEIGNHTWHHIDCSRTGVVAIVGEITRNRSAMDDVMSGNFAYPFGAGGRKARLAAGLCTRSARGISFGINRDVIDLTDLKAVRIYNRIGVEPCLEALSECAARGGWVIFYTHDVSDEPSDYGCTPAQLARVVGCARDRGVAVETVERALRAIQEHAA